MYFFKNLSLSLVMFAIFSCIAEFNKPKEYNIREIIAKIDSIPADHRTEEIKALRVALHLGVSSQFWIYNSKKGFLSETLRVYRLAFLAPNCHAVPAPLMNFLVGNLEVDADGIIIEDKGTSVTLSDLDEALSCLENNKKAECTSCDRLKEFLTLQRNLAQMTQSKKTVEARKANAELDELIK